MGRCSRRWYCTSISRSILVQLTLTTALTEYHCNHIDGPLLAARVFDKGMKKFGRDVTYILSHLDFLLLIRDENSKRKPNHCP